MERRVGNRIPGWSQISITHNRRESGGVALNLSVTGLYVESECEFADGDTLRIVIHLPESGDVEAEGKVVWVAKIGRHVPGLACALGLHIASISDENLGILEKFIENFNGDLFENMRLDRVQVSIEGHRDMHGLRPFNISRGGCYLILDHGLPEIGEIFDITFDIPTSDDDVIIKARVLYSLSDEHAASLGVMKGFGVRFQEVVVGMPMALATYLGKSGPLIEK